MSAQGAPNWHTLWCWLEKDLSNQGKAQSYMLHKCEVENSTKKYRKSERKRVRIGIYTENIRRKNIQTEIYI